MKKVKIAFWLIIFGFIGLVFFQNQDFFLSKQSISLNLLFGHSYKTPELPAAVFFLVCFLAGFFLAYYFNFSERFRSKKTIKDLNATVESQLEEMLALKNKVESLQVGPVGNKEESAESKEQRVSA